MNTETPETDAAYIQRPNEGSWEFKVRQEKVMEKLERERDEWKAKYIQQNKDLGCEMMDPNGTIWDHAQTLQRERDALKALLTTEQGAVTISRNGYVQELERERDEARERADTMFAKHADILDQARRERDEARDACAGKSSNSQDQARP